MNIPGPGLLTPETLKQLSQAYPSLWNLGDLASGQDPIGRYKHPGLLPNSERRQPGSDATGLPMKWRLNNEDSIILHRMKNE